MNRAGENTGRRFVVLAVVTLLGVGPASRTFAQASSPDPHTDFKFDSIPIQAPLSEFLGRFPGATSNAELGDAKLNVAAYTVVRPSGADRAVFTFYRQKLIKIQVCYYSDRINSIGGGVAFSNRITNWFGSPDESQQQGNALLFAWNRDKESRKAQFILTDTGAIVTVIDTAAEKRLNDQKAAQAKRGF